MNLCNKQVVHKSFGQGSVVEQSDSVIKVLFSCGERKFVFPDALGTHLTLLDEEAADKVESYKQEVEQERRQEELELEQQRAEEYERERSARELEQLMKNHKISPASQAVFWCDVEEIEKVFTEWEVFTGLKQSGAQKGQPNRLVRLHQNSACLITRRDSDEPEHNRRIVGAFMVHETFIGKLCETGIIPAHSVYRLRLSEDESKEMRFWNYYLNERYPDSMTWNSGRHRYFDNLWMAQILRDIVELKKGSVDFELAQDFFSHFCRMNQLDPKELPEPSGALLLKAN